jgi:hypothetical protein
MAVCSHGSGQIDPVHQAPAQERTQRIGIIGQNYFRHFGL